MCAVCRFLQIVVWGSQRTRSLDPISVVSTSRLGLLCGRRLKSSWGVGSPFDLNLLQYSFASTYSDTTLQSMRSRLISAYKFPKAGKVKQLRFGNWREKRGLLGKHVLIDATCSGSLISVVLFIIMFCQLCGAANFLNHLTPFRSSVPFAGSISKNIKIELRLKSFWFEFTRQFEVKSTYNDTALQNMQVLCLVKIVERIT